MLAPAVGLRIWVLVAAAGLGIVGQAVTCHYFTDAIGSVLLGTSLVCMAALILRRSRRGARGIRLRLRL
jgi:hypothetical protein